ncbi:thiamine diphosphokinase [Candidatus Odyssella thessalonicensis]|uniref:thiamine diphosphokinase n=1 Tax=Candidatus Odyssella thessalonicensis TaxID=84647 RepID=UPI000225A93F|nr:thiamine diphosphokinase [Candidatus Odyssella thessalonicensis]
MKTYLYVLSIINFMWSGDLLASGRDEHSFLIVANGPFDLEVVEKYTEICETVALDGAANKLLQHGLTPQIILGDMDSISEEACSAFKQVEFIPALNQDYTDLEKGIEFCKDRGARSIIITCALGGDRIDHTLANFSILKRQYQRGISITLQTSNKITQFLQDEEVTFEAPIGGKFGLFGFPAAVGSSRGKAGAKGLEWELNNYSLRLGEQESACNIIKSSPVTISVSGEALMVRPIKL